MRAMEPEKHATSPGLHPPGPALGSLEPPGRWSPVRIAMQSLGVLLALALLGWAIGLAFSDANRERLEQLKNPDPKVVAALLGLSALAVGISGLLFWVVARPERRVPLSSVSAANAIAMGLSLIPLKMGMVARVLIHHRRDGVAFKDIVGWVAAIAALSIVTLGPIAVAGAWRREIDALWWVVGVGGALAGHALGIALGRAAASRPWLARISLGSWRFVRHPSGVWPHALLRFSDLALLGCRFWLAASLAGVAMSPGEAALFLAVYLAFVVGSPFGRVGFAEMGVAGAAAAIGHEWESLALVALTVTTAEAVASIALALIACAYIRPDRLIAPRRRARETRDQDA